MKPSGTGEGQDPRSIVDRLFAAETRGNVEGIVSLMHENVLLHLTCRAELGPDTVTEVRGRPAVRELYQQDVVRRGSAFSLRATRVIVEGNLVCAEWVAACGPRGEGIRRGADVFEIRDGLIVQGTVYVDLTTIP